ncbi:Y-family DNA polymerase [Mesomycoplasma molare]|uniref:UmuC domain-containing protein n=1 Tax=Mesomycoplasma molare TaxID=171288 RepID=A0ABY5TXS1_9BACT|nr:hypothetical protein [Mesomycoplasma molare]UWD34361.1 hypothetical protein NX772_00840 [Mesomycoplasma molare]
MKKKIIIHIDIDSFFVSAERKNNSFYKDKPTAISYNKNNSIAVSLSYEAKERGVKVPWKLGEIRKIIPDIIVVEPNYNLYLNESINFFNFLKTKYTKKIEIVSIDECYLDITDIVNKNTDLNIFLKKMQQEVFNFTKLPVSIGLSYNKFLAKMSTNLAKPFGTKITNYNEIKTNILPLEIEKCYGIGKHSLPKIKEYKIFTIKDFLVKLLTDKMFLNWMGKRGIDYINNLTKEGDNVVNFVEEDQKIISQQITFDEDKKLKERETILLHIKYIIKNLTLSMQNKMLEAQALFLVLNIKSDQKKKKRIKFSHPTNDFDYAFGVAIKAFDEVWNEDEIRFLTCGFTNLIKESSQKSLLDNTKENKNNKVNEIMKKVNLILKEKKVISLEEHNKNIIKNKSIKVRTFGINNKIK